MEVITLIKKEQHLSDDENYNKNDEIYQSVTNKEDPKRFSEAITIKHEPPLDLGVDVISETKTVKREPSLELGVDIISEAKTVKYEPSLELGVDISSDESCDEDNYLNDDNVNPSGTDKKSIEEASSATKDMKKFICTVCDYRTDEMDDLHGHMQIHTSARLVARKVFRHGKEKNYLCSLCAFRTTQKDYLFSHMSLHSSDKPFGCCICNFRTKRRYVLKSHLSLHTGEKPFVCNFCNYITVHKQELTKHMSVHTKKGSLLRTIRDYRNRYR